VHDDYGSFVGTLTVPAGANEDDITATYDKGIFTLSVGVSEAAPAEKHVTVRATTDTITAAPESA
jgi:HSP20 family molecular chaperone IbpA